MFSSSTNRSYDLLPQTDSSAYGLFTESSRGFKRPKGHSFDYIPNVSENNFTGKFLRVTLIKRYAVELWRGCVLYKSNVEEANNIMVLSVYFVVWTELYILWKCSYFLSMYKLKICNNVAIDCKPTESEGKKINITITCCSP